MSIFPLATSLPFTSRVAVPPSGGFTLLDIIHGQRHLALWQIFIGFDAVSFLTKEIHFVHWLAVYYISTDLFNSLRLL